MATVDFTLYKPKGSIHPLQYIKGVEAKVS